MEKSQSNSLLKKPLNIGFCKLNFTLGYSGQRIITASRGGNGNNSRWKTCWIGDITSCLRQQIIAGDNQRSPHTINVVKTCRHESEGDAERRESQSLSPLNHKISPGD